MSLRQFSSDWETDYDTDTMRCQVSLWTRPISAFLNANKESTSSLFKSLFSSKKSKSNKHNIGDGLQDSYGGSLSKNNYSIGYDSSEDYSRGFDSPSSGLDRYTSDKSRKKYHSIGEDRDSYRDSYSDPYRDSYRDSYSNSYRDSRIDSYKDSDRESYRNSNRDFQGNYNSSDDPNQDEECSYDPHTKHWALVFEWEDRVATYEADNVNGYLTPMWRKKFPKGDTWDSKTEVGVFLLSPNQVNYSAKNIDLNGQTYVLGHVNCQEWAKALSKSLDFELPIDTILDAAPMAATLASGAGLLKNNPQKFTEFLEDNPDAIASAVVDRAAYFRDNPEVVTSLVNKGAKYVQDNKEGISSGVSQGARFINKNADTIAAVMGEGAKYLQNNPNKAHPSVVAHASYFLDNREEVSARISSKSAYIHDNPNTITDYIDKGSRFLQENPDIVNNAVAKGADFLEKNQDKISHAVTSGAKYAKKNPEVLAGVATGALFLAKAISKMAKNK